MCLHLLNGVGDLLVESSLHGAHVGLNLFVPRVDIDSPAPNGFARHLDE
jgi:hypothetical protein